MVRRKRRNIKIILSLILFLLGLFIFVFPAITNYLYNRSVYKKEKKFEEVIKNNDFESLYQLLKEENNSLYQNKQHTFINQKVSFEEPLIDLKKYGLEDNIIGYLEIPSIDITLPIYLGASNSNMKLGAVHLTGTTYPIGGMNTNSVIAAHRGFYKTKMFRYIDRIKIGDKLYIKNFKETLVYKAINMDIIDSKAINKLIIQENRDMVTIISCHPYPFNYQRYVVYFERI